MKITEKGGVVSKLLSPVKLPKMFRAKQNFSTKKIPVDQIPNQVFEQLNKESIKEIEPGSEIAVTAGSRGIANVAIITKAIVDFVKSKSAIPFIVPAMGSHGGATAEGQIELLAGYGITEESMGCEIRSSMETVCLGKSDSGKEVHIDKNAYQSDGIIVSCRLKPHNAFRADHESGPCKMMAVGLGKQKGAENCHSDGMGKIGEHIASIAKVIIEKAPILCALADIENAYDQTLRLEAISPENIFEREAELLKFAFKNMPSILVGEADVLIVDEIGKNYSGTGVDPNITGTFSTPFAYGGLDVQRTCFLDLSKESHGNSLGVGLASVITKRLFDKIDLNAMYPNCMTSTVLKSAVIPIIVNTDKEAVQFCIKTANNINKDPAKVRIVRIPNSLHIGEIMLSEAYYADCKKGKYKNLEVIDEPAFLEFDEEGQLITKISP